MRGLTATPPPATILNMPSLQQSLRALQSVDTEIEACRRRIRALQAELADEKALTAARAAAETARAELRAVEQAIGDGEQALERLDRTIAMLQKRLYDGSIHNAKEATSLEEELQHRRVERGATEDAVLAAMERAESAQPAAAAARERLTTVEQARAARLPALKAEGRETTARLQAVQQQRAAVAAAAPPALLARYERLHTSTPPAVVTLHAGSCGGCGVAVPTALQQKVAADELVQCISCGRILVEG